MPLMQSLVWNFYCTYAKDKKKVHSNVIKIPRTFASICIVLINDTFANTTLKGYGKTFDNSKMLIFLARLEDKTASFLCSFLHRLLVHWRQARLRLHIKCFVNDQVFEAGAWVARNTFVNPVLLYTITYHWNAD